MQPSEPVGIDQVIIDRILEFVDSVVSEDAEVWLTGSRVRGAARPDSDWDVAAFHWAAPKELFLSNQHSDFTLCGGKIELVIARPEHWNDQCRYMEELRRSGIRLR